MPNHVVTGSHVLAVVLAAVGAVLFGLSTVRQHGVVQDTITTLHGHRHHFRAFLGLVRQPSWLLGAMQGVLSGGFHVAALALAPITLVQPIGVVAVPVTVVASALRTRQRPTTSQVVGSALSVVGIVALTVLLLAPEAHSLVLPRWPVMAVTVVVLVLAAVVITLTRAAGPPLLRCVALAGAAAVLFGLNSILIRTIGQVVRADAVGARWPLLVVSLVGLAAALPVGVWAMQVAYVSGSPHVVICCLTLADPVSAVLGGHLLLRDDVAVRGWMFPAAVVCAFVAAAGVLLLSRDDPRETQAPLAPDAEAAA